ncbi:MAG: hypothetical protein KDK99_21765 [Verrucomicrobiales bacterium]|nr:hypothetical protein [Verrucomicrobiales bacterium]
MSSIVVVAVSNASRDANRILARQQQAALQSALNGWIMSQMRDPSTGQVISVEQIRATYNGTSTSKARLQLFVTDQPGSTSYLDDISTEEFLSHTDNSDRIESLALEQAKQFLTLPTWNSGEFPKVLLNDLP